MSRIYKAAKDDRGRVVNQHREWIKEKDGRWFELSQWRRVLV